MANIIFILLLLQLLKESQQFMLPIIAPITPVINQYNQAQINQQIINPPAIVRPYNNPYTQSSLSQNIKDNYLNKQIVTVQKQANLAFDLGLIPQKYQEVALAQDDKFSDKWIDNFENIQEKWEKENDNYIQKLLSRSDKFWEDFFKILQEQAENDGDVITARELSRILQEGSNNEEVKIIKKYKSPNFEENKIEKENKQKNQKKLEDSQQVQQNPKKNTNIQQEKIENKESLNIEGTLLKQEEQQKNQNKQENPKKEEQNPQKNEIKKESRSKFLRLRELIKKENEKLKEEMNEDIDKSFSQRLNEFTKLIEQLSQYDPEFTINKEIQQFSDPEFILNNKIQSFYDPEFNIKNEYQQYLKDLDKEFNGNLITFNNQGQQSNQIIQ